MNKGAVGEMGVAVGQANAGALSPAADAERAMKVLLLAGLGALFFAYYWADNFDPGECLGWKREEWGLLSCALPQLTTPAHCQLASREPVCC